jgi:hypothetical protein
LTTWGIGTHWREPELRECRQEGLYGFTAFGCAALIEFYVVNPGMNQQGTKDHNGAMKKVAQSRVRDMKGNQANGKYRLM